MANDSIVSQNDINNQSSHLNKRYEPVILQPHEIIPLNAPLNVRTSDDFIEPPQPIKKGRPGVYVIRRLDTELCKIGCSNNLKHRIKELRRGIKAFTVLECSITYRACFALETALHKHFATQHVGGEWFKLSPADMEFIQSLDPDKFMDRPKPTRIHRALPRQRKPRKTDPAIQARNEIIRALRAAGMTLQEIGDQYGLTRERVRQILAKMKGATS